GEPARARMRLPSSSNPNLHRDLPRQTHAGLIECEYSIEASSLLHLHTPGIRVREKKSSQHKNRKSTLTLVPPHTRIWGRPPARSPKGEHRRVGASLAEEEGFEPTVPLRVRRFSKPVP